MNLNLVSLENAQSGQVELPKQFDEPVSKSLIARAVITIQLNNRTPYGAKPGAGTRVSAQVSRRRRNYRGSYGKGISRVPRKILTRRGSQMYWVGALMPGTVSGRRAHPPKAYKILEKKINNKENSKAMRSALAASIDAKSVEKHGHKLPSGYPFIVADDITKLSKTKEVFAALEKLGFSNELERSSKKRIRAGIGKMRGRKYDRKVGPLIVVAGKCELLKS